MRTPIERVEAAGWRFYYTDLTPDSGSPWFSAHYEGATDTVSARASTLQAAREKAAEEALQNPAFMQLPTQPAERNE
jgi:hypothetical protein